MTEDEAKRIAKILLAADGGCPYCARALFREFAAKFPQFKAAITEVWHTEYEREALEDD